MTLVRYKKPVPRPGNMDQMIDAFFNGTIGHYFGSDHIDRRPRVNVIENDTHYLIALAAPGLQKDDFQLRLEEDMLWISVETEQNQQEVQDDTFTRREYSYERFERSFRLPETIDAEQINATYEAGVLNIELPKTEPTQEDKVRTISVQ